MAKAESEKQLAFKITSNTLTIPERLHDFSFGSNLVEILEQRNSFSKISSKNNMLFFSTTNPDEYIEVNPRNFQVVDKHKSLVKNPRFTASVLMLDEEISNIDRQKFQDKFKTIGEVVMYASPVYIFSKLEKNIFKKTIKPFLKDTKLIAGNIEFEKFTKQRLILWETRKEKKIKVEEVDLMSLDHLGKPEHPWAFYMFERLVEIYRNYGCYIIDPKNSDLYKFLSKCKNRRKAYENLADGNGIKYISDCGCIYNNALNGSSFKTKDCNQDKHTNFSETINWQKQMIDDICATKQVSDNCSICGENMERHGSHKKTYADGSVAFKFETYCPHCGSRGNPDLGKESGYFKRNELKEEWYDVMESKIKSKIRE